MSNTATKNDTSSATDFAKAIVAAELAGDKRYARELRRQEREEQERQEHAAAFSSRVNTKSS